MNARFENIANQVRGTTESADACLKCLGTGWEMIEGRGVRDCQCRQQHLLQKRLEAARIPGRYSAAEFSTYIAGTPSLARALETSRRFVEDFRGDNGLLFLGNCGVGKTHLACAVLKELIRCGCSGLFYDFRDLLQEIKDSYNANTESSELKILRPIFDTDVLVLDELGASRPTEWVQDTITQIINARYLQKRVTLFTTNYLDIGAAVSEETLTHRIGVRLRSRLKEMTRHILIEGDDYREMISRRRSGAQK
jgi:DNA replication protein DnaC